MSEKMKVVFVMMRIHVRSMVNMRGRQVTAVSRERGDVTWHVMAGILRFTGFHYLGSQKLQPEFCDSQLWKGSLTQFTCTLKLSLNVTFTISSQITC